MSNFEATTIIDGEIYTQKQLARYEYQRTLHALHEMKRLGAEIKDGDRILTDEELNWTEPEKAKKILLDLRTAMSEQEMLDLFEKPERDAERRWAEYAADYDPSQVHTATTEVSIKGIDLQSAIAILGGAGNKRQALATFSEHYIVIGDIESGQRGMETFGMFGGPVYVHGATSEIPADLPVQKDPAYPIQMFGEMNLRRDDTPIHVGAYHQFRPTQEGFDVKSTFFCPGTAPAAVADGHKLHFAIEIVNSARLAYENQLNAKK